MISWTFGRVVKTLPVSGEVPFFARNCPFLKEAEGTMPF
jgi:hypothetical protein